MTITAVQTLRVAEIPNLLLVQVHSDTGVTGLGETYYGALAVEVHLHEVLAASLVGQPEPTSAQEIAELLHGASGYVGYLGTGVEVRAHSALDLALWDLLGRLTDRSITSLVGGAQRDRIPVYNTCAGPHYMRNPTGQKTSNWGLPAETAGRYEDLHAFMNHADQLAEDLLREGITAMKIWPFDPYAESSRGHSISAGDLRVGLEPLRKIRAAVGTGMAILVELHGLWEPEPAARIMDALAEFQPRWVEDPIRPDRYAEITELHRTAAVPIAAGETLGGARAVAPLLAEQALDVLIADLAWCGGITEALALAQATAHARTELALHDCSGPIVLAASTQLALSVPQVRVQETTRAYYNSWYPQLVDGLPTLTGGHLIPHNAPGHGLQLRPEFLARPDLKRRLTGQLTPAPHPIRVGSGISAVRP